MLKFKEYITESYEEVIDVDEKNLSSNMDAINSELDTITQKPYQNAPILLNQLRGCLERLGVLLPASMTVHFMNLSAELVYALGDTGFYLYIVYDTNDDGYVDGYAQIVSNEELRDLAGMDSNEILNSDRNLVAVRHSDWYRKRDDDAGNSDEY